MDDSMHCLALGNVIARQEDGRWEGTDRPSLSCPPGQGKVNSPDDIRVDPDQRRTVERHRMPGGGVTVMSVHFSDDPFVVRRIARRNDGPGDGRTLQSKDQNCRRIPFASAERHIHSRVIRRRRSSHGRCRHGI